MNEKEQNTEQKPKKRFNIFDWYYKQGKGSDKADINALKDPSIKNFFKLLWKKFGKLISANLIMVFGNFPLIFTIIAMSNVLSDTVATPTSFAWGPLYGASCFENSSTIAALMGALGTQKSVSINNTITIVFYCVGALALFTWGFTKVGTTYLYRNMMSAEPVFPFSDFIYVFKRNIRQSLIFGIIDALIILLFINNLSFLTTYYAMSINSFMLFLTIAMIIFYSFARPYAYIMIFTFDLKLTKIIKNALYFTILGIKRNLMALLASFALIALNIVIFMVFMPLGIILPFIITLAILDFIGVYAAYPVIIKFMMDERDAQALINKTQYDDELEVLDD